MGRRQIATARPGRCRHAAPTAAGERHGLQRFALTLQGDDAAGEAALAASLGLMVSGSEAISAARVGAPRAASMNTSMTAS